MMSRITYLLGEVMEEPSQKWLEELEPSLRDRSSTYSEMMQQWSQINAARTAVLWNQFLETESGVILGEFIAHSKCTIQPEIRRLFVREILDECEQNGWIEGLWPVRLVVPYIALHPDADALELRPLLERMWASFPVDLDKDYKVERRRRWMADLMLEWTKGNVRRDGLWNALETFFRDLEEEELASRAVYLSGVP